MILEAQQEAGKLHVEMQELVMKLRMVPIGRMFASSTDRARPRPFRRKER
jgi:chemotaxis protein histidine kinase CheA